MMKLTEEDKLSIKKLAKEFTTNTLGDESPNNKCFTICYPLSLHLKNNNIKNSIKVGKIERVDHFIISLEDDDNTIIDPTVKQFNAPPSQDDYVSFQTFNLSDEIYDDWLFPLLNDGWKNKFKDIKFDIKDIKAFLKISIKAANILNTDIIQLKDEFKQSEMSKKYFDGIDEIVKANYLKKEELIEPSQQEAFEILYRNAQKIKNI